MSAHRGFLLEEGATLSAESLLTWVLTATTRLWPSPSKTLAVLVAAAIRCERLNLAQIGRGMAGPITAQSAIPRVWRFTCNPRIEVADGMAEVIAQLVRKRKKRIWISFDGTEFRDFHTLMAAACIQGRAVPLLWASYPEWKLRMMQSGPANGSLRRSNVSDSWRRAPEAGLPGPMGSGLDVPRPLVASWVPCDQHSLDHDPWDSGQDGIAGSAGCPQLRGRPALINPRTEDPLQFLELDLRDTFEFVIIAPAGSVEYDRAEYTLRVLRLNDRDYLIKARQSAYEAFASQLYESIDRRDRGSLPKLLTRIPEAVRRSHHQTVWAEMKRQHPRIALIRPLFTAAPEALNW